MLQTSNYSRIFSRSRLVIQTIWELLSVKAKVVIGSKLKIPIETDNVRFFLTSDLPPSLLVRSYATSGDAKNPALLRISRDFWCLWQWSYGRIKVKFLWVNFRPSKKVNFSFSVVKLISQGSFYGSSIRTVLDLWLPLKRLC